MLSNNPPKPQRQKHADDYLKRLLEKSEPPEDINVFHRINDVENQACMTTNGQSCEPHGKIRQRIRSYDAYETCGRVPSLERASVSPIMLFLAAGEFHAQ